MNSIRLLLNEKSNILKIGFYAIVQRTMPETARTIFRHLMRLHLRILLFTSRTDSKQPSLKEGYEHLHQGRIEQAVSEFRKLIKKYTTNEEAALWLTRTLLIQGNYLEAQKVLFRAIAWHSDSIPLRRQLAGLLYTTGSFWEAEAEFKKLLNEFKAESIDVLLGLAALAYANAQYDEALKWYSQALKIDSNNFAASLGVTECSRLNEQAPAMASVIKQDVATASDGSAVLIIDHYLPSIGSSAGSIHLYEIVKLFCEAGVHVTVIARNGEYQERARMQLEALGVETYATDPERLIAWNYKSRSEEIDFPELLKKSRYVLAFLTRYNIADVYMDLLRKNSPRLPIAIDTEDVHFLREERKQLLYGSNPGAAAIRIKELQVYGQAECLIAVSDPDAKILETHFPEKKISTIPLIYPLRKSAVPFNERKDLLFVGNFVHPPNSDAVVHYYGRILPLLRKKLPGVKTFVVGSNSIPLLESFACDDLILTGSVPSMQHFLNSCRINVAPLRYGAGMNGKVIESMAAGLPVVTTPVVAAGISNNDGLMVAEDPEEFADAIIRLYNDEQIWNSIRDRAYEVIQSRFTPQVVAQEINELLTWAKNTGDN
jgi:glycosyltransferase involved in cell wall biosynthesis/Tfp pilus assembly protein PilF